MISLKNVRHHYGAEPVLDIDHFCVEQGGRQLVLGQSGSGKTTLLHVLAGLLRPGQGTVSVAGGDLGKLDGDALDRFRGRNIGIVFQQLHLLATLTVRQNLLLAPYMAGMTQDSNRVREVLRSLDVEDKLHAYPRELSQGQRQRVAIARAVMNRPNVLLADEPTSSLDDVRTRNVMRLLIDQAEMTGATLLVATHDQRIVDFFPDRLTLGLT